MNVSSKVNPFDFHAVYGDDADFIDYNGEELYEMGVKAGTVSVADAAREAEIKGGIDALSRLGAFLSDPRMNAMTPLERAEDHINKLRSQL